MIRISKIAPAISAIALITLASANPSFAINLGKLKEKATPPKVDTAPAAAAAASATNTVDTAKQQEAAAQAAAAQKQADAQKTEQQSQQTLLKAKTTTNAGAMKVKAPKRRK